MIQSLKDYDYDDADDNDDTANDDFGCFCCIASQEIVSDRFPSR